MPCKFPEIIANTRPGLLTPEGITAKLQLTRDYLVRQEQEYIAMKAEIEAMRAELIQHDTRG